MFRILELGQQFQQKYTVCIGDDLFDISEDRGTENYSS